ncbi:hypothetical protein L6R52_30285 [Myxococcota bacterium]|nr:hypothetical protein [Myxococcota bacterium]
MPSLRSYSYSSPRARGGAATGPVALVALAALVVAVPTHAAPAQRSIVELRGNEVLSEGVYLAVLDLAEGTPVTDAVADRIEDRLRDFLRRAGYDLATVDAVARAGRIVVTIDEGHLDKVIMLGQGAFETLRLKLELSLPYGVFNRPLLERQLAELAERHQLRSVRWELVPVEHVEHVGPQLQELGRIQDIPILPRAHPYELHIEVASRDWSDGLSPELRIDSTEGLGLGVRWRRRELLLERDRFSILGRVAGNLRGSIDERSTELVLSRAIVEARWFTPPLVGQRLRSFVALRGDLLNRQREDLGLESFFFAPIDLSLNLELVAAEGFSVAFGGGVEHFRLFELDRATTVPVSPTIDETPRSGTRGFGAVSVEVVFDPDEIRQDRRHTLAIDARLVSRAAEGLEPLASIVGSHQKVILLGWHELWLETKARWMDGGVLFADEASVGDGYLRGPFSGDYYSPKLASFGAELRFSLARDLFKLGVFHDLAYFQRIDRATGARDAALADAFGLALHALLIDAFSLDVYWGVGLAKGGDFDQGVELHLRQAF